MERKALITGITGQDGAYLAKHLLEQGYNVYGSHRRTSTLNFWRLAYLGIESHERLTLVDLDVTDAFECLRIVAAIEPTEVYNLAAQSFVGLSFDQPGSTSQINAIGVLNLLEAIRTFNPAIKFYQASTSEMFGKVQQIPQTENTPFHPRSPYGVAKLYAHWITINYRETYNIFASNGILFNHESPLRGLEFVTRKITHGLAKIKCGSSEPLKLGNLNAQRDWGFAGEYVKGIHSILQHSSSDSFVLATNKTHSVREFASLSCDHANIPITWEGEGSQEKAVHSNSGKVIIEIDKNYYRPAEVDILIGDATKAYKMLGWKVETALTELCEMMVSADINRLRN